MIPLQLDPASEQRLQELAATSGRDASDLVRQIVRDYLDDQEWKPDAPETWAEASVALAPEVLPDETWDGETAHLLRSSKNAERLLSALRRMLATSDCVAGRSPSKLISCRGLILRMRFHYAIPDIRTDVQLRLLF